MNKYRFFNSLLLSMLVMFLFSNVAFSAMCPMGTWKYYQTDGTWLFDVDVKQAGQALEFRLKAWNNSVYANSKFEAGRLVSKLKYDPQRNVFSGAHYRVEDGGYFDEATLTILNENHLRYDSINKPVINGQSLRRNANSAQWVTGVWKFNQTNGTWLFNVETSRVGQYYEFRLKSWNESVYSNSSFESGRLISKLKYDSQLNVFSGAHYRVEDGGYFDEITLHVDSCDRLHYEGQSKNIINGQSLVR